MQDSRNHVSCQRILSEPEALAKFFANASGSDERRFSFDSTMLAGYDDGMEGTEEARSLGFLTQGE